MDKRRSNHPVKRELTYRDGWRKGKVGAGKYGQSAESAHAGMDILLPAGMPRKLLERYIWRKIPFVPVGGLTVLLCALPAISFVMTWWLVHLLSNN